ncbi:MAG TPA: DUF2007 domain-containing protein [Polyangia bacterium]|jgi:hypothetical protein
MSDAEEERFVTVHRTADPTVAEMLVDVLEQEGIEARLLGTRHAALIGAAQHILPLRIEVPAADQAVARELITALLVTGGAPAADAAPEEPAGDAAPEAPPAAEEPDEPDEPAAAAGRRRRPVLAAGAAFVIPGGCHIYARRPWTGLVLAVAVIMAVIALGAGRGLASTCAAFTFAALLLCDLVFGELAVRATNAGRAAGRPRQLLAGVGLSALALALGLAAALLAPVPKPKPDPLLESLMRERLERPPRAPGGLATEPDFERLFQLRGLPAPLPTRPASQPQQ